MLSEESEASDLPTELKWYAAHIIMATSRLDGVGTVQVMENIYLFQASNSKEVWRRAKEVGESSQISNDSLTIDEFPAIERYVGVRKVIEAQESDYDGNALSGTEITYSIYNVANLSEANAIANDEIVDVSYVE